MPPVLGHIYRAGSLVGLTVPWSVAAMAATPIGNGRYLTPIARAWARQLLKACDIEVEAFGPPEPLTEPAYVVMCNHTSHFDLPSLYSVTPIDMVPVGKKELGAIPFFGWALRMGAAILIDRKDPQRARESMAAAAAAIRSGRSVLMFPEGTRTPTEELGELKKGAFHLAQAARVPVVPVAILGTRSILPSGSWAIQPGRVQVRFGAPIDTADIPDGKAAREALAEAVRRAIDGLVADGRTEAAASASSS